MRYETVDTYVGRYAYKLVRSGSGLKIRERRAVLDNEVRRYYSGQMVVDHFPALGLIVDGGPFGRMMGNLYFRVAQLGIATQIFATEGDAVAWLLDYRQPSP